MLDNKALQSLSSKAEASTDSNKKVSVFIKVIQLKLNGKMKKHFAISKECGKTLAFLETREFAVYYCMSNGYDYFFVN